MTLQKKQLIGAHNIEELIQGKTSLTIEREMILTPGAKDILRNRGISLCYSQKEESTVEVQRQPLVEKKEVQREEIIKTIISLLQKEYSIVDPVELQQISRTVMDRVCPTVTETAESETAQKNSLPMRRQVDASGVIGVASATVTPEPFDTGKEGDKVFLKDVLSLEESPRLGCGVMEMKETSFEWLLKYDEVDVVLAGTLEIVIDGRKVVANTGDIVFIPKDTAISFSVPEYARFIYVTYPADWEQQ